MTTLILSGVGGSSNWLPLVLPLVGIVIVLKSGEMLIQFVKRKRLERENQVIQSVDEVGGVNGESEV